MIQTGGSARSDLIYSAASSCSFSVSRLNASNRVRWVLLACQTSTATVAIATACPIHGSHRATLFANVRWAGAAGWLGVAGCCGCSSHMITPHSASDAVTAKRSSLRRGTRSRVMPLYELDEAAIPFKIASAVEPPCTSCAIWCLKSEITLYGRQKSSSFSVIWLTLCTGNYNPSVGRPSTISPNCKRVCHSLNRTVARRRRFHETDLWRPPRHPPARRRGLMPP